MCTSHQVDYDSILPNLVDRLWHITSLQRFVGILDTGFILVNPPIPDSDRSNTLNGAENYPYVRHIGGVSLFDLKDFDYQEYSKRYKVSSWKNFIPGHYNWNPTIWIEVDRICVARSFFSPTEIRKRMESTNDRAHNYMPEIEAAHIGDIPVSHLVQGLIYFKGENSFENIPLDLDAAKELIAYPV